MKSKHRGTSVSDLVRSNIGLADYLGRLDALLGDGPENGTGPEAGGGEHLGNGNPSADTTANGGAASPADMAANEFLSRVTNDDSFGLEPSAPDRSGLPVDDAAFGLEPSPPDQPDPPDDDVVRTLRSELLDTLFGDVHDVLLRGPPDTPVACEICAHLLSDDYDRRGKRLIVTTAASPAERLSVLETYGQFAVEEVVIVALGDRNSQTPPESAAAVAGADGDAGVERVRDVTDLSRLGLILNKHLVSEDPDRPLAVCFHDFSDLIEDNSLERVFRFLHVLHARIESVDGRAHFHVDPARIDDEEAATLAQVLDVTIEFDAQGDLSVDR